MNIAMVEEQIRQYEHRIQSLEDENRSIADAISRIEEAERANQNNRASFDDFLATAKNQSDKARSTAQIKAAGSYADSLNARCNNYEFGARESFNEITKILKIKKRLKLMRSKITTL